MSDTWTIQRVLTWTSDYFARRQIDAPRLTAELLLAHALGCDRVRLYTEFDRPLNRDELAAHRGLVERRVAGEPTHYLLGRREFYGRVFKVDARVLVPRPETEEVVEAALARLPPEATGPVLDLGAGSGCIGLTLAAERPRLRLVAVDRSRDALEVTRANAEALGVADRIELREGDLYGALADERFALIVSNPPYIASGAIPTLQPEVRREPWLALDGGPRGLDLLERIIAGASQRLLPGGHLVLEIGEDQGPAVLALLEGAGLQRPLVAKDFAGLDRIATAARADADGPKEP